MLFPAARCISRAEFAHPASEEFFQMRHTLRKPLALLAVCCLLTTYALGSTPRRRAAPRPRPRRQTNIQLVLGNPSNATADADDKDNFLMLKKQFILSYNDEKGGANWVSWHLQASDIGGVDRGDFRVDKDLPAGFKRVSKADYNNSGFDRGHLCNSKDRTNNKANNAATFNMTNILPQRPGNNQGPWKRLEDFGRTLARQGNELYILAGAYGSTKGIAHGKVNVPKTFWKVMVVLPKGGGDLSRIDAETRVIAVCMPNLSSIRPNDWRRYVTTVRNVESKTGFNFLSELSQDVQDAVENRKDSEAKNAASADPCQ